MNEIQEMRKLIVKSAYLAHEGHIASALSVLDILYVLYSGIKKDEDVFVLSKGHASLALYVLVATEFMSTFGKFDSRLGGHPDHNKVPGVMASTGSLGHGFPMAAGIALARKIKEEAGVVYCLVGDGECNEGSIWETALIAQHHHLSNLCVIVDQNHSSDRAVRMDKLDEKFLAFGFNTEHIPGHDHKAIARALTHQVDGPKAIIAETTKGYGVARMSGPEWHHKIPTKDELAEIIQELS